ncbi:MAG: EVE domain-containing protein [Chloroflexi bacterium]|nr:EVE domain-containing protein [Chloroflexota bacterium]
MPRNFWMITCNEENFNITREMDFTRQGLKSEYRRKVQRVEKDDRLLFYVMGIRKFTATATVTASYKEEDPGFWKNEGSATWPYLIGIKPELVLDEEQYIEAGLLAHRLDYIRRWPPENWYMAFQGNLHLLPKGDFFLIEEEMKKLKFGRAYLDEAPAQPAPVTRSRKSRRSGGRRESQPRGEANQDQEPSEAQDSGELRKAEKTESD